MSEEMPLEENSATDIVDKKKMPQLLVNKFSWLRHRMFLSLWSGANITAVALTKEVVR